MKRVGLHRPDRRGRRSPSTALIVLGDYLWPGMAVHASPSRIASPSSRAKSIPRAGLWVCVEEAVEADEHSLWCPHDRLTAPARRNEPDRD
jgi:hypothetical protein